MLWFRRGLCCLPAFLVIWSSATFIVSYLIALFRHDVDVISYISDIGATPPESCIFGLMCFIVVGTAIATIYVRYKYVEKLSEDTDAVSPCLNKAALAVGLISCLGMCVVATFQETVVETAHDVGALLFFVSGIIYAILQSILSFRAYPFGSSIGMCRARLAVTIIAGLAFFPTFICSFYGRHAVTTLHIDSKDKGYPFYLTSATCEWIVAFSFIFFFLTFIDDFKMFNLRVTAEYEE